MITSMRGRISVISIGLAVVILAPAPSVFARETLKERLIHNRLQRISNKEQAKEIFGPNDRVISLMWEGRERRYYVHIPPSYNALVATPVVLLFHGGGGSPVTVRRETRFDEKADDAGFIAVYPSAPDNIRKWNVGPRVNKARDGASTSDDIGFVKAVLDDVERQFTVDPKRIYATGFSNGGMMTYRVACEMSDRIAAVAPVATTLMFFACEPSRPVPVIHFHGQKDRMISYNGGPSDPTLPKTVRLLDPMRSAAESTGYWIKKNQCQGEPSVTYQKGEAVCKTHSLCAQGADVTLCTIAEGGHTWPGGSTGSTSESYNRIVGHVTTDISANDEMWAFFKKHALP